MSWSDIKDKICWGILILLVCTAIFTLTVVITASIISIKEHNDLLKNSVGENFKETGVYYLWVYLRSRPKESQFTVMYDKDGNILCDEVKK